MVYYESQFFDLRISQNLERWKKMLGAHTKKFKKSKSKTCISGKNRTQTTNQ